jgi:hypothetical protein
MCQPLRQAGASRLPGAADALADDAPSRVDVRAVDAATRSNTDTPASWVSPPGRSSRPVPTVESFLPKPMSPASPPHWTCVAVALCFGGRSEPGVGLLGDVSGLVVGIADTVGREVPFADRAGQAVRDRQYRSAGKEIVQPIQLGNRRLATDQRFMRSTTTSVVMWSGWVPL